MADNSAFISYRRATGYPWARLIWDELQERSVDTFLDLETMRQAGRFDQRILKQIAARPYFLTVLTEGSLDRCVSEDDWVRRELEYAIEVDRIVVPLFIAPFEPGHFPAALPANLAEVLANSNGVTFYSQFVTEALDQLAVLLEPVALPQVALTDDDAEFQASAEDRIRAEPAPTLTAVPAAPFAPPEVDPQPDPVDEVVPDSGAGTDEVPPIVVREPWAYSPPAVDPQPDPVDDVVPDSGSESAVVPPVVAAEPPARPPEVVPRPDPAGDAGSDSGSAEVPPVVAAEPSAPPPDASGGVNRGIILAAAAVVIIGIVGVVLAVGGGGDEPEAGADTAAGSGASEEDADDTEATADVDIAPPVAPVTRLSTDDGNAMINAGDAVVSSNGRHELVMTADGQLVLRTDGVDVWEAPYEKPPVAGAVAILQESDGNFVVYPSLTATGADDKLWAIDEQPGTMVELRVDEEDGDGYVAVYQGGREVWRRPEPAPAPAPVTEAGAAPSTTSAPEATAPTTVPNAADVRVVVRDSATPQAIVDFEFTNAGGEPGEVTGIEMEVLQAFGTRLARGQDGPRSTFDLGGQFVTGDRCTFEGSELGWSPIPPTTGDVETRSITFGGVQLAGLDEPELFAWAMELRFTVTIGDGPDDEVVLDASVSVPHDPAGARRGSVVPDCA